MHAPDVHTHACTGATRIHSSPFGIPTCCLARPFAVCRTVAPQDCAKLTVSSLLPPSTTITWQPGSACRIWRRVSAIPLSSFNAGMITLILCRRLAAGTCEAQLRAHAFVRSCVVRGVDSWLSRSSGVSNVCCCRCPGARGAMATAQPGSSPTHLPSQILVLQATLGRRGQQWRHKPAHVAGNDVTMCLRARVRE